MARVWHLASRPLGAASRENFRLVEMALPALREGEVRVRNRFLSVEPALRSMMVHVPGYPMSLELDQPIWSQAVGEVVETRSEALALGDIVFHYQGWRDEAQGPAGEFEKLPVTPDIPDEYWLATAGMAGITAWFGLTEIGQPVAGETLFVSAAAGSVGSNVVQIAKLLGLRVIGSAGGAEKCAVVKSLGADAVIDYKLGDIAGQLRAAAPEGIDIHFDNVGGDHLDAALLCSRLGARFVVCGMISGYDSADGQAKVPLGNLMQIVARQITIRGFMVASYEHRAEEFRKVMLPWLREGKVRPLIAMREGLESTPDAFLGLFTGANTGKTLVRV